MHSTIRHPLRLHGRQGTDHVLGSRDRRVRARAGLPASGYAECAVVPAAVTLPGPQHSA
jgi:hypothetical protein